MYDYIEISENIKQQRYAQKLTQDELAQKSGVSLPTIKKIEGGKSGIRKSTVIAIAEALEIEPEELFRPAVRLKSIRFRSCKNMRSREGIVADIITTLGHYNRLEELTGDYLPALYRNIEGSSGDPASYARQCRAAIGLDDKSPVADVTAAVTALGIKQFTVSVNTDKFFSLSVGEEDGGPVIIINNNKLITYEQAVFSLIHELGHMMMHRGVEKTINAKIIWAEEDEADLFASYFLMPEKGLREVWEGSKGLSWADRVIKVKHIFNLSYKTVVARLGDFKELSNKFVREYDGIKDRKDPESLNKRLFLEERFYSLAIDAVKRKLIKKEEALEMLGIDKRHLDSLISSEI